MYYGLKRKQQNFVFFFFPELALLDFQDTLIRFRVHPLVAVFGDIAKRLRFSAIFVKRLMWYQLKLRLWCTRFTRQVFAVTSSPFLLISTLLKHVTGYEKDYIESTAVRLLLR